MRRIALAVLLAASIPFAAAPAARAQDTEGAEKPAPVASKTVVPITGEKVWVKLKGGIVVSGITRGPKAEILRGRDYVPVENRDVPGAGIKVYYAMDLNGFLFVPYEQMESIRFEGQLSEEEGEALARRIEEKKRQMEEERARARAELEARKKAEEEAKKAEAEGKDGSDGTSGAKTTGEEEKPAEGDGADVRARRIKELLKRFPPTDWKPSRLDEIKKRAIILDIFPNEEEQAFMDNYDLWLEGYEMWQRAQESKK